MKIDLCEYDKEGWPPVVCQELIRDKFVRFGLADDGLKKRLLREVDVSLTKAVEMAQRAESSKGQVKEMVRPSINVVQESEKPRSQYKAISTKSYVFRARPTHEISKCKNFVQFSSLCIGHMGNRNESYSGS